MWQLLRCKFTTLETIMTEFDFLDLWKLPLCTHFCRKRDLIHGEDRISSWSVFPNFTWLPSKVDLCFSSFFWMVTGPQHEKNPPFNGSGMICASVFTCFRGLGILRKLSHSVTPIKANWLLKFTPSSVCEVNASMWNWHQFNWLTGDADKSVKHFV